MKTADKACYEIERDYFTDPSCCEESRLPVEYSIKHTWAGVLTMLLVRY